MLLVKRKVITLLLALIFLAFAPFAAADGCLIPPVNRQAYETGQKAVIFY